MDLSYSRMAVLDLLDAFASSEPVPGGGSAAALAGAAGASLLLMVAGMPKTRNGTPEETADLAEAAPRLRAIRDTLADLIDRDSEAYAAVVAALRRAKGTADEQTARKQAITEATEQATEIPLETMRLCQQALRGGLVVARAGYSKAASDVGVGIQLLLAGLRGAALNVDANLESLTDEQFARRVREEREELEGEAAADAAAATELLR